MRLKEIQFRLLTLLAIALFFVLPAKSQVNIGKDSIPHDFSILELSTDILKGGLRLPQLSDGDRDALPLDQLTDALGLVIYNTTSECLEFWNGEKWVSLCASSFKVDPKSLNFAYNESGSVKSKTVTVTTTSPTWSFSVTGVNAGDFAVIQSGNTLDVYPLTWNYGDEQRTATITVTSGSFTETVEVTQEPYEAAINEVSSAPLLYVDDNGKLQLGRWGIEIDRDHLLNFKFGSVIGFIIPSSASIAPGTSIWEGVDNIKFNPSNVATNEYLNQFDETDPNNSQYNNIPYYDVSLKSTYPTNTNISLPGYHNGVNVLKGLGDPCKLVGYTGAEIAAMTSAQIDAIKSSWRMPTKIEDIDFVGASHTDFDEYIPNPPNYATKSIPEDATHHFWGGPPPTGNVSDINSGEYKFGGGWFEITSGNRNTDANKFLPVVGYRAGGSNAGLSRFQGTHGFFWSSTSFFDGDYSQYVYGFALSVDAPNLGYTGNPAHTYPVSFNFSFYGFPIRCVPNTPTP